MKVFTRGGVPDVLMVTNAWPRDDHRSYGIFIRRQIESLTALGLRCDVIFVEGYRGRSDYLRAMLHMLRLNWSSKRPRLVHGHGGETALVVRCYVRSPVMVSYCGDDLLGTPRADGSLTYSSRVRRFILRHQARLLDASIVKSDGMRSSLPTGARTSNFVLPNGVDRSRFRPRPREQARAELGWPCDERIVLFAADPELPRKRHWLAALACREAEDRIGPIRLQVANGVAPDDMPRLMAAADCLLLTSSIEGSPNVVKEAVSCGLPVVAVDVGDVRQILKGVEPSWVCLPRPIALGDALVQCLSECRRSNGWERSAWLSEEQIGARLLSLYAGLAEDLSLAGADR